MKQEEIYTKPYHFKSFVQECTVSMILDGLKENWVLDEERLMPYNISIYKWFKKFPIDVVGYNYNGKFYMLRGACDIANIKTCIETNKPFVIEDKRYSYKDLDENVKYALEKSFPIRLIVLSAYDKNGDLPLEEVKKIMRYY